MKDDSVTISLKRYHQLKDAESLSKNEANATVEHRVDEEIKKFNKSNILIEQNGRGFMSWSESKHILTDSEAVKKIGDQLLKLQSIIDEKIEEAEKEGIQYKEAYNKLKKVKWYNLLFGIKEFKTKSGSAKDTDLI